MECRIDLGYCPNCIARKGSVLQESAVWLGKKLYCKTSLYCNMRWLAWEEIVLQYSLVAGLRVSLYYNGEGRLAGKGSVSRYNFCIVTETARLAWG